MALSDTFTTLGNTIINLVNSRTAHKQNQLIAGDGIQITENTEEKNADICIHPDIEAAFQSVIDEIEAELPQPITLLLEDIIDGSQLLPEEPFIVTTNLTEIIDNTTPSSSYKGYLQDNTYVTSVNLNKLQSVGNNGLYKSFAGCTNIKSVDLSNVKNIGYNGLWYAFENCVNLATLNLINLQIIGDMGLYCTFINCESLAVANLSSVTTIEDTGLYNTFSGCKNLISVDLGNVKTIGRWGLCGAFEGCTNLTSLSFPKLNNNFFGDFTDQFNYMLTGVTGCTVHFPSNLESIIGGWSSVIDEFGGINTTVLFDLPATT